MTITDYLDLTYLGDDKERATDVINTANSIKPRALCISPCFVSLAKSMTDTPLVTVANFPLGNDTAADIAAQISQAVSDGIKEIDIVFPYTMYLSGQTTDAFRLLETVIRDIPKEIVVKIIIETAVYDNQQTISAICEKLIALGVDFIKTSTGTREGAELQSATTILQAIKKTDTQKQVGFKASGGIRTVEQAQNYLTLAKSILGSSLTAERFRIGSSGLGH